VYLVAAPLNMLDNVGKALFAEALRLAREGQQEKTPASWDEADIPRGRNGVFGSAQARAESVCREAGNETISLLLAHYTS
jgi:hypothetical protein